MRKLLFPFIAALMISCNYSLPLIRFKSGDVEHFTNYGNNTKDHQAYRFIHISRYGILGYARKDVYRSADSLYIDSVQYLRTPAFAFDARLTSRIKKTVYDTCGNHKIVVKTKRTAGAWSPTKTRSITKIYVPIRRIRTVERY